MVSKSTQSGQWISSLATDRAMVCDLRNESDTWLSRYLLLSELQIRELFLSLSFTKDFRNCEQIISILNIILLPLSIISTFFNVSSGNTIYAISAIFSLNSYALLSLDIIGVIPDITWLPERKFVTVFSTAPDLMLHQMLQITLCDFWENCFFQG